MRFRVESLFRISGLKSYHCRSLCKVCGDQLRSSCCWQVCITVDTSSRRCPLVLVVLSLSSSLSSCYCSYPSSSSSSSSSSALVRPFRHPRSGWLSPSSSSWPGAGNNNPRFRAHTIVVLSHRGLHSRRDFGFSHGHDHHTCRDNKE